MNIDHMGDAKRRKILLVDDDADFRWALRNVIRKAGYSVLECESGTTALKAIVKHRPDLMLLDYRMPGMNGLEVVERIKDELSSLPVIMITAYAEVEKAVTAMKMGVYDYITKPVNNSDLLFAIRRALEKRQLSEEIGHLKGAMAEGVTLYDLMGDSKPIRTLAGIVAKVASTSFTVLIEGESGSGKELVARTIHNLSHVSKGPFITVDCGAIPETLIESELFGYMRGAFTGAHQDKPGQFELAEGGSIFLDEVGNIPYQVQHKLLRTMEERHVRRLGGRKSLAVNVRIIAATNRPLARDIRGGRFREDLYYRLNEFVINAPPLRDRKEDIVYLINKFMSGTLVELKKKCKGFSREALTAMINYNWPGNVRELKNIVRQAVLLCDDKRKISPEDLNLGRVSLPLDPEVGTFFFSAPGGTEDRSLKEIMQSFSGDLEKRIIEETIRQARGNKSEAARRLAIDYKTLLRKIKAYRIE